MISNRNELIEYINQGHSVEYVFFWGHRVPKTGVSKSCFSQWYVAPFQASGISYSTAEQYMMAEKARLFRDDQTLAKILTAQTAAAAKKLGRQVKEFNNQVWNEHKFDIVVTASVEKFRQNSELKDFLRETGNLILVEASPTDRIWGIGLAADNPSAADPAKWKGENLLGFALMVAREQLSCS